MQDRDCAHCIIAALSLCVHTQLSGGLYSLSSHDRTETQLRRTFDRRVWYYYSQTATPCVTSVNVMTLALSPVPYRFFAS
jgi:hypothetical protein